MLNPRVAATLGMSLVNGRMVIDQGRHTGTKPGSVLRGAGYEAPAPNESPR